MDIVPEDCFPRSFPNISMCGRNMLLEKLKKLYKPGNGIITSLESLKQHEPSDFSCVTSMQGQFSAVIHEQADTPSPNRSGALMPIFLPFWSLKAVEPEFEKWKSSSVLSHNDWAKTFDKYHLTENWLLWYLMRKFVLIKLHLFDELHLAFMLCRIALFIFNNLVRCSPYFFEFMKAFLAGKIQLAPFINATSMEWTGYSHWAQDLFKLEVMERFCGKTSIWGTGPEIYSTATAHIFSPQNCMACIILKMARSSLLSWMGASRDPLIKLLDWINWSMSCRINKGDSVQFVYHICNPSTSTLFICFWTALTKALCQAWLSIKEINWYLMRNDLHSFQLSCGHPRTCSFYYRRTVTMESAGALLNTHIR